MLLKKIKGKISVVLMNISEILLLQPLCFYKTNTIIIIKLDALGDYVLFRNFIPLIKEDERYHNYKIYLLGNKLWKDLAESIDSGAIDKYFFIDKQKIFGNWKVRFLWLLKFSFIKFDTLIQPTYSKASNVDKYIIKFIKAKEKIGFSGDLINQDEFHRKNNYKYYNHIYESDSKILFEFYRNRLFFEKLLSKTIVKTRLCINIDKSKTNSKKIAIAPGAGADFRQWNANNYVKVINYITNIGHEVVLIGSKNETKLAFDIIEMVDRIDRITNNTGKTSLTELVYILNDSNTIICNDSGVLHLSAALQKRVICISNGNHFGRFVPYPKDISNSVIVKFPFEINKNSLDEYKNHFMIKSEEDINLIKPEEIILELNKTFDNRD